ncbi:MAG: zinc-dependent metalloprotease, partial [Longimicrobiales bacterium]
MGVAPTIMDYARQNYVAQPGDGLEGSDFLRQIGPYDHYVINWGYRVLPEAPTPEAERPILDRWIVQHADDPTYRFLQGPEMSGDPRAQTEDIGDDHVRASTYGIMNLQRVTPNLLEWTTQPGENYTDLEELYGELVSQWGRYVNHVANVIGGVRVDLKTADQAGAVYTPVDRPTQERALAFIAEQVLDAPLWLLEPEIIERISVNGPEVIQQRQAAMVNNLLADSRLGRMLEVEVTHPTTAYPVADYLDDVRNAIWGSTATTARDAYRRALQRAHVERLAELLNSEEDRTDIPALARAQLVQIRATSDANASAAGGVARAHLRDIVQRVEAAFEPRAPTAENVANGQGRGRDAQH